MWLAALVFAVSGCTSVDLKAGFPEVRAAVGERAAAQVAWNAGTESDPDAESHRQTLLQQKLTADTAVQIALLNSRDLQAIYADLGLVQADLVQAGLFKNPILDAAIMFPLSGARPDLQLSVAVSILDALYVPLRKRVATARFEEVKLRVTGAVLDFAFQVRAAFYAHQANEQIRELRQAVVQTLNAALEVSRRLHQAGNISDLDLARERAQTETAKLALRTAEIDAVQSRERLNILMGLWGEATSWELDGRMPDIPAGEELGNDAEGLAVERSLDLAHARQRIVIAGHEAGLNRASALVPDVDLGASAERESGEGWKVGPAITIPLPIFDQGQARIARAAAELRRAQQEYYALAVRLRSAARAVQDRIVGARERALYYRDILLPLREQIVNETQLHYNAMQVGVLQLLRDRELQIETGVAYVETLRDYWLARTDLAAIASGRLPASADGPGGWSPAQMRTRTREGH